MKIKDGAIFSYFTFDIASEIALDKLERVLGKKPEELKLEYSRITPKYVQYAQPPLMIKLGMRSIQIGDKRFDFKVIAKLYDFGVVTVRFKTPFAGTLEELEKISIDFSDSGELEKEAEKYMEKIQREIKEELIRPVKPEDIDYEDYTVFYIKEFEKKTPAKELLEQSEHIARVLRGEREELSKDEIAATVPYPISYFADDLAFVDWHAAFVYDPREAMDTFDVLEYANIVLLELRVYDTMLDKEIDKAYDEITKRKFLIALDPYSAVIKNIEEVHLDITQTIEKVENALKLVGDLYLAKVYRRASQAFHIDEWKASTEKKLDIVENIYDTLNSRTQTARNVILEVLIVILIIFEIIIAFSPK